MGLVLLLTAGLLLPYQAVAAQLKEVRRVLILNVMGPLSSPGVASMDDAIVSGLQRSPYQIELYSEDLEANLFPDEASQRQFREWYIHKYRDRKPDVDHCCRARAHQVYGRVALGWSSEIPRLSFVEVQKECWVN